MWRLLFGGLFIVLPLASSAQTCELVLSRVLNEVRLTKSKTKEINRFLDTLVSGERGEPLMAALNEQPKSKKALQTLFKKSSSENKATLVATFKELGLEPAFKTEIEQFDKWKATQVTRMERRLDQAILHSGFSPDQVADLGPQQKARFLSSMITTWRGQDPDSLFLAKEVFQDRLKLDDSQIQELGENFAVSSWKRKRSLFRVGLDAIALATVLGVGAVEANSEAFSLLAYDQALESLSEDHPHHEEIQRRLETLSKSYTQED